ncbi:MAG: tetratricopeptide repeat protein [Bacteroidetes bacterium]|nr:tetratricopeptide repeat protein [Bacteroidota bacterium]
MLDNQPQIFLSYSWANKEIADAIDNDFKSVGITFQRDVRDVMYTGDIKNFMNKIGKSDFVVMLISDEYIKSENCMYEVTELLSAHEFEKRILPVILYNAEIYNRAEQEKYYKHWDRELKDVERLLEHYINEKTLEDKRKFQNINNSLGLFFQKITNLKSEKYEELKKQNYQPMLNKIGFDEKEILSKIMSVIDIKDKEDQELAIEDLLKHHPQNRHLLFQKAFIENKNKNYKKARKYYEDLLEIYPDYANAYNNLGIILKNYASEPQMAKECYEKAIEVNPLLSEAYINLALLLKNHFNDYKAAQKNYEKAIEINPLNINAHISLGFLLKNCLGKYAQAEKCYNVAIELDPHNSIAYINLANLKIISKDYAVARTLLETALKINPSFAYAHYNLACILKDNYEDYTKAKEHYRKAIQADPTLEYAYYNLGNLLQNYFDDYDEAKKCYESALDINPKSVKSLLKLGLLLEDYFSDYEGAKNCYALAVAIDPENASAHNNYAILLKRYFLNNELANFHYNKAIELMKK